MDQKKISRRREKQPTFNRFQTLDDMDVGKRSSRRFALPLYELFFRSGSESRGSVIVVIVVIIRIWNSSICRSCSGIGIHWIGIEWGGDSTVV